MVEKGDITEQEAEEREKVLLERDTRNILLGGLMSMISSITTLYIVQNYIVQKTAAAAIAESRKYNTTSNISKWKPLSKEQLDSIYKYTK